MLDKGVELFRGFGKSWNKLASLLSSSFREFQDSIPLSNVIGIMRSIRGAGSCGYVVA